MTKSERKPYDKDLHDMKSLGCGVAFWVYLKEKPKLAAVPMPDGERRKYPVFEQLVFDGVVTHLKNNAELSIYKRSASGIRNTKSLFSTNGAFVLCELKVPANKKVPAKKTKKKTRRQS